jgi:ribosomal protein L34E
MVQRLTYRRRHSYHTKSNRTRIVKTPGEQGAGMLPRCRQGLRGPPQTVGRAMHSVGIASWAPPGWETLWVRRMHGTHHAAPACAHAGGRLVFQYVKKQPGFATCPVSGARLNGVGTGGVESNTSA